MFVATSLVVFGLLQLSAPVAGHDLHGLGRRADQLPLADEKLSINGVPFETRAYWMREANQAMSHPCPFAPFGTVIVNHTAGGLGELVCIGENSQRYTGNPTLHGT